MCCFVLHWTKKLLYFFFLSMYNCTPCIFFFSKPFPLPLPLCSRHPSFHRNGGVMTLPVRSGISASALVDSFHFTHKASPSYLGLVLKKKKKSLLFLP